MMGRSALHVAASPVGVATEDHRRLVVN